LQVSPTCQSALEASAGENGVSFREPCYSGSMVLDHERGLSPMEAVAVDSIPDGDGWQYEPKWDGFRCLAFKDGDRIELQSSRVNLLPAAVQRLPRRCGGSVQKS
jgi:ATP-dependent DNA ligase